MSQKLNWKKVDDYCIRSGRYLIALVRAGGPPMYLVHCGDERLGLWVDDPKGAKAAAQKHYDDNNAG